VTTTRTSASRPSISAPVATEEGRAFLQERLVALSRVLFALSLGFHLMGLAVGHFALHESLLDRAREPAEWLHAFMSWFYLACWLSVRSVPRPAAFLQAVDAAILFVSCIAWPLQAIVAPPKWVEPGFQLAVLLPVSLIVVARSGIIPSPPRRTLRLTGPAVIVAVILASIAGRRLGGGMGQMTYQSISLFMWGGAALAVATVTSRTIYGLQQRMKEARDVGAYRLIERIAGGGMGEVWRAEHRLLIRPAAVKLIKDEMLGARGAAKAVLRRFEREARATAQLSSPHTVELFDFGVDDSGALYYAMELLDGIDLEQLITRFGPLPEERVVYILRQVCHSLADAHAQQMVHRDVKPSNIVLCRLGLDHDFVKVLDFGLVKTGPSTASPFTTGLGMGAGGGTPAYMAPEAHDGGRVDGRTDLYALGCVAYFMLTGHLVFESGSAMQVMIDHAQKPPVPPSKRTEMPISPLLENLIIEMLDKNPTRRPADARLVRERLDAIPLESRWDEHRARRWWELHMPAAPPPSQGVKPRAPTAS
jgi:serine/threonine-protein kinase